MPTDQVMRYSTLAEAQAAPDSTPCYFHPERIGEHNALQRGQQGRFGEAYSQAVIIVCAECAGARQDLSFPWAEVSTQ